MICTACRGRHHDDCRGGSWCDCQNDQHTTILTSQQRSDLAAFGITDPPRVCPTCPLAVTALPSQ